MSSFELNLDEDLKEKHGVRIQVQSMFTQFVSSFVKNSTDRDRTPKIAKSSLRDFYELVNNAVTDCQKRANTPDKDRVILLEEDTNQEFNQESITFRCVTRSPGAFSQGAPGEGKIKNLRPIYREQKDDPDNPGYRLVTTGYFYDNMVCFTCWARTHKQANLRADWFEDLMEEYRWYFKSEGIDRTIFLNRREDKVKEVNENKWYGRPLDFFVRTEKIRVFSEKSLEDIVVNLMTRGAV